MALSTNPKFNIHAVDPKANIIHGNWSSWAVHDTHRQMVLLWVNFWSSILFRNIRQDFCTVRNPIYKYGTKACLRVVLSPSVAKQRLLLALSKSLILSHSCPVEEIKSNSADHILFEIEWNTPFLPFWTSNAEDNADFLCIRWHYIIGFSCTHFQDGHLLDICITLTMQIV